MTSAGGPGAGGMRGVGGYWFWTIGATCSIGGRRALRGAGFCWEHSALRVEGGSEADVRRAVHPGVAQGHRGGVERLGLVVRAREEGVVAAPAHAAGADGERS